MQTLPRTGLVLIWSAIACLGTACDKAGGPLETEAPMETGALTDGPSFSGSSGGGGGGFFLGGTAQLAQDPENPANDVIRIRTDIPPFFGTVSRTLNVKINTLDNMLEFKSRFTNPKTCIGGAPRVQLAIDLNGDGTSEGNAFGYFGPPPSFAGCLMDTWLYEDLTGPGDFFITGGVLFPSAPQLLPLNEETEWDLTQFVCPVTMPPTLPPGPASDPCIAHPGFVTYWSNVEQIIGAFPNHQVCTASLTDDTFGAPGMTGTAHYDLFSAGRATWVDRSDIAGRGFARGCARPDHGDDEHDGDHDGDHDDDDGHDDDDDDDDDDDKKYDKDRRDRHNDD